MLFVSFSMSRGPWSWVVMFYPYVLIDNWDPMCLSGCPPFCTIISSVLLQLWVCFLFSHFILDLFPGAYAFAYHRGVRFAAGLLSIGFFLDGFFIPGNAHRYCFSALCSVDWWRRATTTDILQCVNERIFQQSICVVCVYVLAENRQELQIQVSLRELLRMSYF